MKEYFEQDKDDAPLHTYVAHPAPKWASSLVGLGIIIVTLGIGGVYIWNRTHGEAPAPLATETRINNEPETPRATADIQILETMSPSDELSAISADIESTKLDTLDTEIQTIDSELSEFENKIHAP